MIKHIVLYKLKDNSPQKRQQLVDTFLSMKNKIDVLRHIEAGVDVLGSERSFDVVLVCHFDSLADMDIYQNHPVHIKVKEYVQSVKEKAVCVDFEL